MQNNTILIVTIKSWNIANYEKHKQDNWFLMTDRSEFTLENIKKINPKYIFIPHWSWIIADDIWKNFECVVFHMADLPYGRGGSPLQNQIVRGIKNTKISAIKIDNGIDTGDVYMKRDLSLSGSAREIFIRASDIIFGDMIPYILQNNPIPTMQVGEILEFKRRKKEEGELKEDFSIKQIYDHIRMLDGEGYPPAFLKFGNMLLEFSDAKTDTHECSAKVKFIPLNISNEK